MSNPQFDSVYGYYTVGKDQYYLNKTEALYSASKANLPVKWNFHEEVFSKLDWAQRPPGTLREMYRERAQQLRDKYDHIIAYFSGGMDSWTVLHSFLSNNIHLDEVVTRFPRRAERKIQVASLHVDQSNVGSEYEFAVYPVLKQIEKSHPNVNIVVDDFSDTLERELEENEFKNSHGWQSLMSFTKYARKTERELEAMKQNKKVAVVIGAEKTHVLSKDGNFYGFFADQANGGDIEGRNVEFFYWSKEFPLIPILQTHCLKDYISADAKLNPGRHYGRDNSREIYALACYPDYNIKTFQVNKFVGTWDWPSDQWINKYNPTYFQSWQWMTSQYFKSIDDRFVLKNKLNESIGFQFCFSPYYQIASNTGLPDFTF